MLQERGNKKLKDYPANSHKAKIEDKAAEKKKVEKVVKGRVKVKKKGELGKFAGMFISEDVHDVKSYVITDVIVPLIKKGITETIDMILYGGNGSGKSRSSKISYSSYYDRRDNDRKAARSTVQSSRYDFDNIILESRGEAEEVIERMQELLDTYKVVSVADLYDLVGVDFEYTDNKYGWTNLRNAEAVRTRDGYMLKLPKALPID